jgi:hypothetical protein
MPSKTDTSLASRYRLLMAYNKGEDGWFISEKEMQRIKSANDMVISNVSFQMSKLFSQRVAPL